MALAPAHPWLVRECPLQLPRLGRLRWLHLVHRVRSSESLLLLLLLHQEPEETLALALLPPELVPKLEDEDSPHSWS